MPKKFNRVIGCYGKVLTERQREDMLINTSDLAQNVIRAEQLHHLTYF